MAIFSLFFCMYNKVVYQVSELIKNLRVEENLCNYKKFLYKNGIAENGDDFVYGSSIPLEFNIVFLNGGNLVCLFLHENENKFVWFKFRSTRAVIWDKSLLPKLIIPESFVNESCLLRF